MPRDRIVPLIIAVVVFMENMDSTAISTSLPATAEASDQRAGYAL